ncbi:MAG: hypothetical protein IJC76_01270 [Lachnospiraceae bacterium]|nr:hypothetical protein [Lachnospiraceae bacterium]
MKMKYTILGIVTIILVITVVVVLFNCGNNADEDILINEDNIRISITKIRDKKDEFCIELSVRNYSEDTKIVHCGTNSYNCNSVNGYMNNEGYLNIRVEAGKKETGTITFKRDRLDLYGIDEIKEVQLGIYVQNDATKEFVYYSPITVQVSKNYDKVDNKSLFSKHMLELDELEYFCDEELYSYNDIVVKSAAFISNEDGGKSVLIEVVNNSTKISYVGISEVAVNRLLLPELEEKKLRINPGKTRIIEYDLGDVISIEKLRLMGFDKMLDFDCNLTLWDSEEIINQTMINIVNPDVEKYTELEGTEVFNKNGIRIVSKGFNNSYSISDDYVYALFLIENNTSEDISFTNKSWYMHFEEGSYEIEIPRCDVPRGYKYLQDIEIYIPWIESDMEKVENINKAEFSLKIMNEDNEVIFEPEITINKGD